MLKLPPPNQIPDSQAIASAADSIHGLTGFEANRYDIERHDQHLLEFTSAIDSLWTAGQLTSIEIEGLSSPEGPVDNNNWLALRRAASLRDFITTATSVPASIISIRSLGENWDGMSRLVHTLLSSADCNLVDSVTARYSDPTVREQKLKELDNGRIWQSLLSDVFPHLRVARARARYGDNTLNYEPAQPMPEPMPEPEVQPEPEPESETAPQPKPIQDPIPADAGSDPQDVMSYWYLKTNAPAWGMLWTNIAAEFDVASHWSITIPVYYSGFNYFTSHRKFRTFTCQPEARYWFNSENHGLFAGAHLAFCYFNVAFNGDTRYQDHNGHSPAYGGGLSIGYRFNFCRNPRWKMEVSLGAGVYALHYDTFDNFHNGQKTGTYRRTFVGIDNAAVSFCYRFDLKRRKQ